MNLPPPSAYLFYTSGYPTKMYAWFKVLLITKYLMDTFTVKLAGELYLFLYPTSKVIEIYRSL